MLHVLHKAALSRDGGGVLRAKYENDIFLCACASSGRWGYGNTSGGFMLRGIEAFDAEREGSRIRHLDQDSD